MAKRKRRSFTGEFKAQAVKIVRDSGKPIGTVARELDLTETPLRSWLGQGEIDAGDGRPGALTTEEREITVDHPSQTPYAQAHQRGLLGSGDDMGMSALSIRWNAPLIHINRHFFPSWISDQG